MKTNAEYQSAYRARHGARTGVIGRPVTEPCGTYAAYRRHLNAGETPCDACRAANAERLRQYRQSKS